MRKYFIDNIRWLAILLLFPYHVARIFDTYEIFYVKGNTTPVFNWIITLCNPWFMPLLFVLAGASTYYALQKRTKAQYLKERFSKLFIPLVAGILLVVPIQTYYAERLHNNFTGGYFAQYILFFTKETDLSGYYGGFSPTHLWFIFYLFLISAVALPFIDIINKLKNSLPIKNVPVLFLPALFILPLILYPVINISGKSIGENLGWFFLGYFVLTMEEVELKLEKTRWYVFFVAALLNLAILKFNAFSESEVLWIILKYLCGWVTILAILGLGKRFLNFRNSLTAYFTSASFAIYIFHQSVIVAVGYYIIQFNVGAYAQYVLIMVVSFILTVATYEVCKRIGILRYLFGISSNLHFNR